MTDYLAQINSDEEALQRGLKEDNPRLSPQKSFLLPAACSLRAYGWMDTALSLSTNPYTLEKAQEIFVSEKVRLVVD